MAKILDKGKVGHRFAPYTVTVEEGRLRFFAKAIGENNPVYTDPAAARAAGYAALPASPTFAICLARERPNPFEVVEFLGIPFAKLLHGEQSFTHHAPIVAGDEITFETEIIDIYDKKDGALEFAVTRTTGTNQDGVLAVEMGATTVVRH